jgi:CHASE2 domain-containing sensor protein
MIEPGSEPAKGLVGVCVLVVTTAVVVLALARLPLLRGAENWLHDIRLTAFSPSVPLSADVVLVTIDEETLATLPYRTPVDRGLLADLISALDARGARAIGLDLLLDQPTERERDLRLRQVLDATRAPVVLASTGLAQGLTEVQAAFLRRYTRGLRQGPALVDRDPVDGTVRRIPLVAPHGAPTFVAELARVAGVTLPASDAIALNYPPAAKGAGSGFSKYAARWVATAVPDAWIRDRIVLIGVDLLLEDRHRTPFAVLGRDDLGHMPGVEIHAFALQQLLDGARERVASPWLSAVIVALAAALGAALGIRVATARGFAGVQVLGGGGFLAAAFALSSAGGPVVPVVGPLLAFAGTSAVIMIRRWYAARKHAAFLTSAFSRYVAPTIVEQLVAHPEKLRLNGERRELTFLFTDVAGFTTLTESMPAEQLVAILNEYIDGVCRILIDDGGTIEKIVGDAVHVMFKRQHGRNRGGQHGRERTLRLFGDRRRDQRGRSSGERQPAPGNQNLRR